MSRSELKRLAAEVRAWLYDALALWADAGFDPATDQFQERLDFDGRPLVLPRRAMVQARQMFVFSAAGRLGWDGPWRERLTAVGEMMLARGRSAGGHWIKAFAPTGEPADPTPDLYTQAFAVFGFAHAGQVLSRADFVEAAADTVRHLETWRRGEAGYHEGDPADPVRRQNPHMHLLEAFLALDAAGDPDAHGHAREIAELAQARFIDPATGALLEYFDEAWRPLPGEAGRIAEPGHEFEWSWLLRRYANRSGGPADAADRLRHHGETLGIDPDGRVYDEITAEGAVVRASSRLWPHTERLKAAVAAGAPERDIRAAWNGLSTYFVDGKPGLWRDRRLPEGGWEDTPVLASSAYHIVCACEELLAAVG